MAKNTALKQMIRDIEVAISETDKGRSYGGHRHGLGGTFARAGWNGQYWVSYARIKNRWRVVGKGETYQHAIRVARAKAARG